MSFIEKRIWDQLEHVHLLRGFRPKLLWSALKTRTHFTRDLNFLARGNLLEIGGFISSRKIARPAAACQNGYLFTTGPTCRVVKDFEF